MDGRWMRDRQTTQSLFPTLSFTFIDSFLPAEFPQVNVSSQLFFFLMVFKMFKNGQFKPLEVQLIPLKKTTDKETNRYKDQYL